MLRTLRNGERGKVRLLGTFQNGINQVICKCHLLLQIGPLILQILHTALHDHGNVLGKNFRGLRCIERCSQAVLITLLEFTLQALAD